VIDQINGDAVHKRVLQLLVLLAFAGFAIAVRGRATRVLAEFGVKWRTVGACMIGLIVVLLVLAPIIAHPGGRLDVWLGRLLLQIHVFRADATLVLWFALLAFFVATRSGSRSLLVGLLRALAMVVLVLAGLDLTYFRATGLNGDAFAFNFLLANLTSMGFLLRSGLDWLNVGIIAFYVGLLPAFLLLAKRLPNSFGRHELRHGPWPLFAMVMALWAVPEHHLFTYQYQQISHQLHVSIVADLINIRSAAASQRASHRANRSKPLADWRNLTFSATRNTKALNVVIIILESTRARSVTPYNPGLPTTPFLAELAKHSLLVEDMNAVIPQTSKAWTAVLTGLHPVTTTLANWSFAEDDANRIPSLPRLLRPHGYQSAFFTPAHLKFDNDLTLLRRRGFDHIQSDGDYDSTGFERSNYYGFEDRIMLRPSLAWVDRTRASGKPFFLTYMTLTGHHDYQVPKAFSKVQYPSNGDKDLNDYLNSLHYVDGLLRDIFSEFAERGLIDSTLFVIVGDHGQSFGEHGARQHHGVLYDEALRIPGLLHAPHLWSRAGTVVGPRQQIDILPTIADALGFEITGGYMPGSSMLRPVAEDRSLFFMDWHDNTHVALRRGSTKYLYTFEGARLQAFDLKSDPLELRDMASNLTGAQIDRVEDEMFDWQERVVDVFLKTNSSSPRAH
jgi:lipoteichoic acid synthase